MNLKYREQTYFVRVHEHLLLKDIKTELLMFTTGSL